MALSEHDREALNLFFSRNPSIKRADFYCDAIMGALARYEAGSPTARDDALIAAGRTQIDPSLVREATR